MGRSSTSSSRSSSASSSGSSSSSSGSEDAEEVRRRRSRAARKRKAEPEERAVEVEDSDSDSSTADERRRKKKKKRSDRVRRLKKRSKGKRKRKRTKRPKKKRSKRKSARDDSGEESAPAPAFAVATAPPLPAPPLREAARSERGPIPGDGFERADGRPELFERERDFPRRRGDGEYENGREERRPDERDGDRKRRRRHGEGPEPPDRRPRRFDEDEIRRRKRPDRRDDSAEERDDRSGAPPRPPIGRDRVPRRDRRSSFAEPMPSSGRRDESYASDDRVDYRTGRSDCGGDRAGGFRDKNENFNGRPRRQFGHRTDDRCAEEREAPVRREHVAGTDRDIKQQRSSDRERIYTRDKNQQSSSFKRDGNDGRKRFSPRNREWEDENATYEWGKKENNPTNDAVPVEKEKPNFALSGKLTEDTNTVNGVVIKYSEPPEARKPKRRWRFYPFKGDKALPILYIHRQSCFLLGRDRTVADIPLDHPSVSKQHAALQYRLVPFKREDGSIGKRVRPYIIDLGSANGTFVNNKQIDPKKYVELLERDVVKFGFSQREYVLLHENSKDDDMDDDDVKPTVKIEDIKSMVQIKSEPEDL